jgi:hypothetical protein
MGQAIQNIEYGCKFDMPELEFTAVILISVFRKDQ